MHTDYYHAICFIACKESTFNGAESVYRSGIVFQLMSEVNFH